MNILLVEDYQDLQQAMAETLKRLNHEVVGLDAAEGVDAALAERQADLALVDLNLPKEDGLSLIKRLRHAFPDMGIIAFSARNSTLDRISGYESGADIYLTKPVVNEELVAAVQAVGRRVAQRSPSTSVTRDERAVELDSQTLELRGPQGSTRLTTTEFTLLTGLARAIDRTLTTAAIYDLLGRNEGKKSALEALVYRVRRKLASIGAGENCIRAHRLKGYQLLCPVRMS